MGEDQPSTVTRVALLRPCSSPTYGGLVHQMLTTFLNQDLHKPRLSEIDQKNPKISQNSPHLTNNGQKTGGCDGADRVRFDVEDFDVVNGEYPKNLDDFHGVVVVGSVANAYDNEPWILRLMEFIQKMERENRRLVGICFGHQIIGRALGAKVRKNPNGGQQGTVSTLLSKEGREMLGINQGRLECIFTHNDEVYDIEGVENDRYRMINLGGNDKVASHGLVIWDKERSRVKIFSLQGHPEYFTASGEDALVKQCAKFTTAEPRNAFKSSCEQMGYDDSILMAELIGGFLRTGEVNK